MTLRVLTPPVESRDLARRLAAELPPPVAVVAMGSPWHGDDAAAIAVARDLAAPPPHRLFNVETAPESFLVPIAECGARSCLLVDALDAGQAPGAIVLLEPEDLEQLDATTHGLSPKAFLQALRDMSGMQLLVLGIQAGPNRQGEDLSAEVAVAARTVSASLELIFTRAGS